MNQRDRFAKRAVIAFSVLVALSAAGCTSAKSVAPSPQAATKAQLTKAYEAGYQKGLFFALGPSPKSAISGDCQASSRSQYLKTQTRAQLETQYFDGCLASG